MINIDDPLFDKTFQARDAYWAKIGDIDPDVIAYMISPQFQGMPPWPTTRQAFKVIRTKDSLIIASDGLSDPFVDTDMQENGFENEVYIETRELIGASFDQIKHSWQFSAIEIWARNVANYGGINNHLEQYGVVSVELQFNDMPDGWISAADTVGVLVNIPAPGRNPIIADTPLSPVTVAALTLLRPDELAYAAKGGQAARDELVQKLQDQGQHHMCDINRESVL